MERLDQNREKNLEQRTEIPNDQMFTPAERSRAFAAAIRITDYPGAPPCEFEEVKIVYHRMLDEMYGRR